MKMKKPQNGENLPIRNSTAEFLIFAKEAGADTIAVRFQDEMLWLTQPLICQLFDVAKSTVSEHLSKIFASGELSQTATVRKYRTVRQEGSREVERELEYYSLEAIIAVGYRVNSRRATDFRRWAMRSRPKRPAVRRVMVESEAEARYDTERRDCAGRNDCRMSVFVAFREFSRFLRASDRVRSRQVQPATAGVCGCAVA